MLRIRLWQWPNLFALDAVLIALLWQAVFAQAFGAPLHSSAQIVLGLSVWLTYMADRLFDVAKRSPANLHSTRHRFAKQHPNWLWKLWGGTLILNILVAFSCLSPNQLRNGAILLCLCLAYTALNQTLSRKFFPKELCVAIIYTGGVIVFSLPNADIWPAATAFGLLCLINCLIIGTKEQRVDAALQVRSLNQLPKSSLVTVEACCALSLLVLSPAERMPIALSLTVLIILHATIKRYSTEAFRVLADGALLIGPIATWAL